jgi:hypothetical protein
MKQYKKSEFAQEVRNKYPGSYDDLSDAKLIELWLKKFPHDKDKITEDKLFNLINLKWFNILTLSFFCNVVPIYIFYHPGALYVPRREYFHHTDSWPLVFFFMVAILIFAIKNFKNKFYLISSGISIFYIIGFYFYPFNYLSFDENFNHHLTQECTIYSTIIIVYNSILAVKALRKNEI